MMTGQRPIAAPSHCHRFGCQREIGDYRDDPDEGGLRYRVETTIGLPFVRSDGRNMSQAAALIQHKHW